MKQHIYFVNAHPDDLNACMGLCMRLSSDERYQVHVVDVTRGERGLAGKGVSLDECAAIRTKEEESVCAAMGLTPAWLGEIDGESCASKEACQKLAAMFAAEPPRAIITQWLVDRHVDHVVAGTVALNALRAASGVVGGQMKTVATEVYFYAYASNSVGFMATHYFPMDDAAMKAKMAQITKYACQNGEWMAARQREEDNCCGQKVRAEYAEAFESFQLHTPGSKCLFDEL